MTLYYYTCIIVLLLLVVKRQWKMRIILNLSRKLKNKYVALPVVGHGLMFLGNGEDRMTAFKKMGNEAIKSPYGLTSVWLGSQYYACTSDPIIADIVCKVSLQKPELRKLSIHLLGNGLLFAPTHIWRPRRKILAPKFSPKNFNRFVEIFVEQSLITVECLKSKAGKGTFSLWNNIVLYSMDSIFQTALGVQINAQTQPCHPFLIAFENYAKIMADIVVKPWLQVDPIYNLALVYKGAEKLKKTIHDFVDDIIRKSNNSPENQNINLTDPNSYSEDSKVPCILDFLRKSSGENSYTDIELREEILVLLLAATDTTAVSVSFICVMLSRHFDVQNKVYKELHDVFGDSKRPITLKDVSRLTYINAVIKETMRLYPAVPMIVRENEKDVQLPSGITLPVGSCIGFNIWGIHRNPKYWGADAEEFNPDRFLNRSFTHRSAFMPFSSGPRNCIGYKYAMMSMTVLIASLLREYRVLPPSGIPPQDLQKPLRVSFDITMKAVDNFEVRLEHRSGTQC